MSLIICSICNYPTSFKYDFAKLMFSECQIFAIRSSECLNLKLAICFPNFKVSRKFTHSQTWYSDIRFCSTTFSTISVGSQPTIDCRPLCYLPVYTYIHMLDWDQMLNFTTSSCPTPAVASSCIKSDAHQCTIQPLCCLKMGVWFYIYLKAFIYIIYIYIYAYNYAEKCWRFYIL